jgi:hypothetical protein
VAAGDDEWRVAGEARQEDRRVMADQRTGANVMINVFVDLKKV